MKQSSFVVLAAVLSLGVSLPSLVQAQGELPQETVPSLSSITRKRQVSISIHNVKPSLIAWWLDPKNNGEPSIFRISRINARDIPAEYKPEKDPAKPLGDFVLPTGVDRIIAVDPQNTLLVYGTDAAVTELKKSIELLDKPLRQVEIEVQYVQINSRSLDVLGLVKDPDLKYKGDLTVEVAPNLEGYLSQLVAQNKARIITTPRVTAIYNLTASLRSETVWPAALGFKDDNGKFRDVLDAKAENPDEKLELATNFGVTVTPSLQDDGSIDLVMAEGRAIELKSGGVPILNRYLDGVQGIGNLKDGETIALVGASSSRFSYLDSKLIDKGLSKVLILVTVRKIHRVGDEN